MSTTQVALTDEQFLDAFEGCTLAKEDFPHREHVRLAWLYLGRHGFDDASQRVVDGIKRFAAHHVVPGLYHETVTRAWLRLIAAARRSTPEAASYADFLAGNPQLTVKGALDPYYDPATLSSDAARAAFVDPDRAPLP